MADHIFMKLTPDVPGTATEEKHKNWIPLLSWSWGMSIAVGSSDAGGQAAIGTAHFQDFSATAFVDKAWPEIGIKLATGDAFTKVEIEQIRTSKNNVVMLHFEFTDAFFTSLSCGGSGGDDMPTQNFTVSYGKVKWGYNALKPDGTEEGMKDKIFNLREQKQE